MQTDNKTNDQIIEIYQDYIDSEGYVQRYDYDKKQYCNTGTCLKGPKGNNGNPGRPGKDGLTPRINPVNRHWMIGNVDTGVSAGGSGGSEQIQLKTINGESIEGTGNITTKSYHVFNNTWNTSSIKNLCESMVADSSVEAGMSYYGKFTGSGLPSPLGQAEMTIEVIANDISNGKSLVLTVFSADTTPYKWETQYVKINGNYPSTITWRTFQQQITSSNKLDYSLLQNTPTIPVAQIQSDWSQTNTSAKDFIKNKPTIPQIWSGTQVQYDALAPNYDANTIYIIS